MVQSEIGNKRQMFLKYQKVDLKNIKNINK